jgi:hypothetical protein
VLGIECENAIMQYTDANCVPFLPFSMAVNAQLNLLVTAVLAVQCCHWGQTPQELDPMWVQMVSDTQ